MAVHVSGFLNLVGLQLRAQVTFILSKVYGFKGTFSAVKFCAILPFITTTNAWGSWIADNGKLLIRC
jgi:hypothetical protein